MEEQETVCHLRLLDFSGNGSSFAEDSQQDLDIHIVWEHLLLLWGLAPVLSLVCGLCILHLRLPWHQPCLVRSHTFIDFRLYKLVANCSEISLHSPLSFAIANLCSESLAYMVAELVLQA